MSPPPSPLPSMFAISVKPSWPSSRSTCRGNRRGPPAIKTAGLTKDSPIDVPLTVAACDFLLKQPAAQPATHQLLGRTSCRIFGEQADVTEVANDAVERKGPGVRVCVPGILRQKDM